MTHIKIWITDLFCTIKSQADVCLVGKQHERKKKDERKMFDFEAKIQRVASPWDGGDVLFSEKDVK